MYHLRLLILGFAAVNGATCVHAQSSFHALPADQLAPYTVLECAPAQLDRDSDPVYKIVVKLTLDSQNDETATDIMIVHVTRSGALLAAIAPFATASAQSDYPNRPVQLIVPYGPGGVADVGMRTLADQLSARLKQQFVVENRPGGMEFPSRCNTQVSCPGS